MSGTEALALIQLSLLAKLPQEKLKAHNEAFEVLRKLVIEDATKRKRYADTDMLPVVTQAVC